MLTSDDLGHSVTELVGAPAEAALRFLADGARLGEWAFGCWNTVSQPDGGFLGHSLFDGAKLWVRVETDAARMCVTFHVGGAPDRLAPRILALVVPGPLVGRLDDVCLVTLLAWRDAAMDADRWRRLTTGHAAEILLLRALIERDAPSHPP